ncbi:hypothetical protein [Paralcaligenes sp. KSB-10]|jgi:hypothetical protein|nr:hypothetical protein [Paralcaligenes sp. KSB-10]
MKRFIKLVCLYLGLILVLTLQARAPSDLGGPMKVEYEYQQF